MSDAVRLFQEKVTALGRRLGLDTSTLEQGEPSVEIGYADGSNVVLACLEARNEISLSTELFFMPPPGERSDALCRTLLAAHAFGLETDGVCFGLNREADKLIAFRCLDLTSLDDERLAAALTAVVQARLRWRGDYEAGRLVDEAAEAGEAPIVQAIGFNFA
ncbi:type III secretion system chaperone [Chitinimonas lacunae]|uniref:Type III secretion system chaperone n=1 Tax=Chitinimonas lacunae TaxID=1963018 RepID=A0ABV8MPE5_9NEIS